MVCQNLVVQVCSGQNQTCRLQHGTSDWKDLMLQTGLIFLIEHGVHIYDREASRLGFPALLSAGFISALFSTLSFF